MTGFNVTTIIRDQLEFVRSPATVLQRLANDPHAAAVGFRHILAIALLYEIAILLWSLGAEGVTLPAFLKIPEEQYYFYELIFLIPVFLVYWLLAAGIAYLTSKALGGRGAYDALLGGFGLTMAVSAYFTLIPDYVQGVLWTTGWLPFAAYQAITGQGVLLVIVWAYMLAYVLAHLLFYSLTVRHTQGLDTGRSIFVAAISFLGSFAVWITFVR
ncbi:MAG: hypothetical protein H3C34_17365 [Caldilineaceae bacterium]|nr:hypothetical protein [Caldilineaceae bacterium]